jgi:uncharacterized protein YjeT (DUF2065 family)
MIGLHFPQGLHGWTVFATGILLIAYRIRGIDAPRAWAEWIERQFAYAINLRFIGGILLIIAALLGYYGSPTRTLLGLLFAISVAVLGVAGLALLFFQNHARHMVIATAESSDMVLRIASILTVVVGFAFVLLPFFL